MLTRKPLLIHRATYAIHHTSVIIKKKSLFEKKSLSFFLWGVAHTYKNPSPVPFVHFPLRRSRDQTCRMAFRGKEELQLQHLLNNLGYNLLQFSNRMTDLIVSGSPELSLIARTQLMTSLGLLSMKTMELCQAWDQFEYAYKSTGITLAA